VRPAMAAERCADQRRGHGRGAGNAAQSIKVIEPDLRPIALLQLGLSGAWAERAAAYATSLQRLEPDARAKCLDISR
jgi:hypothetical protein